MNETLEKLIRSWELSSEWHQFNPGVDEKTIAEFEKAVGWQLPDVWREFYTFSNGASLVGGNVRIYPLTGDQFSLQYVSTALRGWEWPIPPELWVFGDTGSDAMFGLWVPVNGQSPGYIIELGEIFEPGCMAIAGTSLEKFLLGRTVLYAEFESDKQQPLDAIELPQELRIIDPSDEEWDVIRKWADPMCPGNSNDPYKELLSASDINRLLNLEPIEGQQSEHKTIVHQEFPPETAPDKMHPHYEATLESVRSHPLPQWYSDAKFGIFIHWGVYSIPAYAPKGHIDFEAMLKGETTNAEIPYTEWYQNSLRVEGSSVHQHHLETYGADYPYAGFAPQFNSAIQAWNPNAWASLFSEAGAKYVVLVTKHHDGFLLWPSAHPNPRIADWHASRDIVGELTEAVTTQGMNMGFYYSSLLDWSFTKRPIKSVPDVLAGSNTSRTYRDYVENHWRELMERYDPWILWSDIGYPPGYKLPELFADFYNRQPEGVLNDRWGQIPRVFFNPLGRFVLSQMIKRINEDTSIQVPHSDFSTPEFATLDRITDFKWETCRGIGNGFAYNQLEDASDYMSADELIHMLVDIVSKNGNLLLNVGPRADGSIPDEQVQALQGIGKWLRINGEAIYGTQPWKRFGDSGAEGGEVRYTKKDGAVYATVTTPPDGDYLILPADVAGTATLLENAVPLQCETGDAGFTVHLPESIQQTPTPVIKILHG